jgi:hypothetical protein
LANQFNSVLFVLDRYLLRGAFGDNDWRDAYWKCIRNALW